MCYYNIRMAILWRWFFFKRSFFLTMCFFFKMCLFFKRGCFFKLWEHKYVCICKVCFEFFTEFLGMFQNSLQGFFEYSLCNSVESLKGTFIGFFQKSYDFAKTWVYLLNIVKSPLKMSLSSQSLREFRL